MWYEANMGNNAQYVVRAVQVYCNSAEVEMEMEMRGM